MKKNLLSSIKNNISEIYTGLILVLFIPVIIGFMTNIFVGLLLSFVIQSIIGILFIRNSK